ncbi:MAG TPA: hypothetical protein PLS03_11660, partial [Terrimicrobiaceae bacterium]|nr:hypothetical protein [Terrimicrobiaceae bacterium]
DWEADFLAETPDKLTWIRSFGGRFYGVGNGEGHVFEISRSGCRRVETGLHTGNRVMGGIHQIGPDLFACLGDNGLFAKFSLTKGPVETVQVDNHTTTGMNIYTLRKDPGSNQAVGSHFINSQIFHLDLATGISRSSLNRIVTTPGQITCVTFLDGVVYLAVYGYAILQAYRPDEPFAFGNNPRTIMRIGCQQHRPVGLLNDGKSLFMATRADYGMLGGAISVINPANWACEVYRDFVPTQNPVSLFLHQGLLIGTTEIYGDQGSCLPKASCAVIFAWSIEQRATVHTFSPWECKSLRALGISPSGTMIGFGSGKYFLYDSSTKTCTVHPWTNNDPGSGVFLDNQRFLTVVPAGKGRSQVLLLNVETHAVETVDETEGLRFFELLDSGEILAAVEGATVAKVRLHDF